MTTPEAKKRRDSLLRNATCPICGTAAKPRPYHENAEWMAPQCPSCGYTWVVDLEALPEATAFSWGEEVIAESEMRQAMYNDRIRRVERLAPQPRTWLDVGCGGGGLLRCVEKAGFQPEGIELSPSGHMIASRFGIPIHAKPLPALAGELNRTEYGVVSYFHVLEHVTDLRAELDAASRVLSKDGYLVVEVPFFGSFPWRILGARHRHFYRAHRSYFNPKSLSLLLSQCGFTVLGHESVPYEMTLDWVLMRFGKATNWLRRILPASLLKKGVRVNTGEYLLVLAKKQRADEDRIPVRSATAGA